ncbi:GntR family transcriptional regulator [Streptomyces diastatochromogenes]|nr:GntR family transcriptional regulator [Streptomyces diastatochromogenes]
MGDLMAIERRPLREQIRDELMDRLTRGEFSAGSDVNEAALAAELGVSRTPLREALIAMAGEGVLESSQGRGFRFAPVSRQEFRELVAIVAALEALALESSDPEHLRSIAPRLLELAQGFPTRSPRTRRSTAATTNGTACCSAAAPTNGSSTSSPGSRAGCGATRTWSSPRTSRWPASRRSTARSPADSWTTTCRAPSPCCGLTGWAAWNACSPTSRGLTSGAYYVRGRFGERPRGRPRGRP